MIYALAEALEENGSVVEQVGDMIETVGSKAGSFAESLP